MIPSAVSAHAPAVVVPGSLLRTTLTPLPPLPVIWITPVLHAALISEATEAAVVNDLLRAT